MKKIICFVLALSLILCSACTKAPEEELYNYEVVTEPFESMKSYCMAPDYKGYSYEQQIFDESEMVFIGMLLEAFAEGEQRFFDINANELESGNAPYEYTVRNVKVIEMIKGDSSVSVVPVADESIVKESEDGEMVIAGERPANQIAKKNAKYVYYVSRALPESMDFYFVPYDCPAANIDGLDTRINKNNRFYDEIRDKFSEQFVKYDRSAELVK